MSQETINLLIGLGTGILSTVAGGVIVRMLSERLNKFGEIKKILRIIDLKPSEGYIAIDVTFQNHKRDVAFIRDLCLFEWKDGSLRRFIQIDKIGAPERDGIPIPGGEKMVLGENGYYSFAIPPREAKNIRVAFLTRENPILLNSLLLGYYDDNEHLILVKLPLKSHQTIAVGKDMVFSNNYKGNIIDPKWN
ncbi:MAG: hypothetical protein LKM30_05265 [Bacilli bacterium]|jgi:hypothetical protein|nr:hypothetical protein [Bacilli bacterium]